MNRQGHYRDTHTRTHVWWLFNSRILPQNYATCLVSCLFRPRAPFDFALAAQKDVEMMTTPALYLEDPVKLQKVD